MNGKNSKNKELEGFLKKTQMILAKGIKKGERGYRKFFRNKISFKGEVRGVGPYQTIEFRDRERKNELEIPESFRLGDRVKITVEKMNNKG